MSISAAFAYAFIVIAWHMAGFAVLSPPIAWCGMAAGWWMNRTNPLASRLAGALVAAMVGAAFAQIWHSYSINQPEQNVVVRLGAVGWDYFKPLVQVFSSSEPGALLGAVIFYAPLWLAVLLCIVVSRYEGALPSIEGLSGVVGGLRQRVAEYRAYRRLSRSERIDRKVRAAREKLIASLPLVPAEEEAAPPMVFEKAESVDVYATPGEPVTLPTGLIVDGAGRGVTIVIHVQDPPTDMLRLPRGSFWSLSGFLVGTFYALRIVTTMWFPIVALGLWFFGPALLAYETHQITDALGNLVHSLRPF